MVIVNNYYNDSVSHLMVYMHTFICYMYMCNAHCAYMHVCIHVYKYSINLFI